MLFERDEPDQKQEEEKDDKNQFQMFTAAMEHRETTGSHIFFEERPINNIFLETSKEQDERVRLNSPYGALKSWKLIKIIVKSNDDVR